MDAQARFEVKHNGNLVGVLRDGAVDHVSEHLQEEAYFWFGMRPLRRSLPCAAGLWPIAARTPICRDQA